MPKEEPVIQLADHFSPALFHQLPSNEAQTLCDYLGTFQPPPRFSTESTQQLLDKGFEVVGFYPIGSPFFRDRLKQLDGCVVIFFEGSLRILRHRDRARIHAVLRPDDYPRLITL